MGAQEATARFQGAAADDDTIEAATGRLTAAIDALEAAAERRAETDRARQSLAAQLQSLGADRSKLAAELDAAVARSRRVESANLEVSRRLSLAIDSIRSVLEATER
jgi:Domain of unknown function (DUF4164)